MPVDSSLRRRRARGAGCHGPTEQAENQPDHGQPPVGPMTHPPDLRFHLEGPDPERSTDRLAPPPCWRNRTAAARCPPRHSGGGGGRRRRGGRGCRPALVSEEGVPCGGAATRRRADRRRRPPRRPRFEGLAAPPTTRLPPPCSGPSRRETIAPWERSGTGRGQTGTALFASRFLRSAFVGLGRALRAMPSEAQIDR